jgi:hypothetical protein
MQKLAAKAEAATSAPKPKSVTQIALKALPANGVTFKSVTVAEGNSKGDSLIVANAAQALAPAPAAPGGKLQKRLAAASACGCAARHNARRRRPRQGACRNQSRRKSEGS